EHTIRLANCVLAPAERVQSLRFAEDRSFRRVQVLWLRVAERTTAERNVPPRRVQNREHDAIAKARTRLRVLVATAQQATFEQSLDIEAHRSHVRTERTDVVRRKAKLEAIRVSACDSAALEVGTRDNGALGVPQLALKVICCRGVHLAKLVERIGARALHSLLRNFYAHRRCDSAQRIRKAHAKLLLQKREHVA